MSKLINENGVAALIELIKKQTPNTYSKQEIDTLVKQNRVSVDGSLSTSSPNPVSNRVVTSELSKKLNSTSVTQVALTGSYNDLKDKPSVEEAVPQHIRSITQQDITNWNNKQDVISDLETIRSKANSAIQTMPNFATVATSGDYDDLTNKPTIPDVSGKQDKRTVEYSTITADWVYNDYGMPFTAQVLEGALDGFYLDWRNEANAVALCNALVAGNGMQDVELSKGAYNAFSNAATEFDASDEYDSFYSENSVGSTSLTPTNYVDFGTTDSVTPTLPATYERADEFLFTFTCNTDNCALTLPGSIAYGNGLDFDADKAAGRRFQVSICDGIALYAFVDNSNS